MKIASRTFLISGASSGLGLSTARLLHSLGANLSLLDLNAEAGAKLVHELGGDARTRFFECDVTETESVERAVKATVEWVAETGRALGGVVPAAGVGLPGLVSCVSLLLLGLGWMCRRGKGEGRDGKRRERLEAYYLPFVLSKLWRFGRGRRSKRGP